MHPVRKQRLYMVIFIVLASSVAVGFLVQALGQNMNLFYPPSQIVAGEAPEGKTIRAGGCVVPGSIVRDSEGLKVRFEVTDGMATLPVVYDGILPDLFGEGEATVLTGKLESGGEFNAVEVLAKHDETYMPSEVADSIKPDKGNPSEGEAYQDHSASCKGLNYDS
ncbi:MAG: cytochrome c-type biogenesis protein CcmE [Lentisphaeria bacterium]|jgi:cytochrome c-type biogenesis protein CcmE